MHKVYKKSGDISDVWRIHRAVKSVPGVKSSYCIYGFDKTEFGLYYNGVRIRIQGNYLPDGKWNIWELRKDSWDISVSVHSEEAGHFAKLCDSLDDLL